MSEGFIGNLPRALAVWLVIIAVESVHGVLRTVLLAPSLGDLQARQISVFSGALLILATAFFLSRWMRARANLDLIAVGLLWMVLTVVFEILLGRCVMGLPWERIRAEYDITSGSLLPLGLLFMVFAPLIAYRLQGSLQRRSFKA